MELKFKYSWLPYFCSLALLLNTSCEDWVSIAPPKTQLVTQTVFEEEAAANAAMAGVYADIAKSDHFSTGWYTGMAVSSGMSADEYSLVADYADESTELYENELTPSNARIESLFWTGAYRSVYEANSIIEGVSNSKSLSATVKDQLEGEARFIRAFNYFYLVNFFGDVPLLLTTDYKSNSVALRTSVDDIYDQIIVDLKRSQELLLDDYSISQGERVRANKWVATTLLARVYLYSEKWADAEAEATAVINNSALFSLEDLDNVFLKESKEAIWQFVPSDGSSFNAYEAYLAWNNEYNYPFAVLSSSLVNSFEIDDDRASSWLGSMLDFSTNEPYYYANKYKARPEAAAPYTEYSIVLRLTELYLIRAEARAQLNNVIGAQEDLNQIRTRAGLANTAANSQSTLLNAIEHERQVELFAEGGHRWLDLKRWNRADAVIGPLKPGWQATDALYPIPQTDRLRNPFLTQNPGYLQ